MKQILSEKWEKIIVVCSLHSIKLKEIFQSKQSISKSINIVMKSEV